MKYAVVDVETTGFSVDKDEVLEIAIVGVDGGVLVEPWVSLVRPSKPVGLRATKVHGIDNDVLMTAPRKAIVAREVKARLRGTVFVEHNLDGFDRRFVAKLLGEEPWSGNVNTLREARRLFPELGKYDLPAVCAHLGVPLESHHYADADAMATANILLIMLSKGLIG